MRPQLRAARLSARVLVDGRLVHPNAPHGTWGGYTNWFCRCDPCRRANAAGVRGYAGRKANGWRATSS